MMRVIAGSAKGTKLKSPAGRNVRPTTDRVREAMYNILVNMVPGADFLDLCAGSGAVGIEALSRGADRVVFVEKSAKNVRLIKSNLRLVRLEERGEVLQGPVERVLPKLAARGERFDIIFADPPYASELVTKIPRLVTRLNLLEERGIFVLEHSSRRPAPGVERGLQMVSQREYGDTTLSFYRCKSPGG